MARKVLITGATGTIGWLLAERLHDDYDLVLQSRKAHTPEQEGKLTIADPADYDEILAIMAGVDTVVHLAAAASPESTWEEVLPGNIIACRNVFEAAREAGVRRFVFASTNHVYGMYDRDNAWPVPADAIPRPDSLYGVTKVFGEALGSFYHDEYGMDVISLRIGWSVPDPRDTEVDVLRALWLSPDDTEQIVRCAIEAPVTYGVYYAISDNPNRRWDMTNTMLELGYRPKDSWTDFVGEEVVPGGAKTPADWPANS